MVKVAILHPDLGIGGAERLIVDVALAFKNCLHDVTIYTSHHDENHCFDETKNGQLKVVTAGDWLPRCTFGRLMAFWAYVRMIYLTCYVVFNCQMDIVLCDQVSAGIPILKLFKYKCIFYCHFPDQLLTKRESFLKKVYRYPLDWFEEWTTGLADIILVNSLFTKQVFYKTFKSLKQVPVEVLYPSVNFKSLDRSLCGELDIKLKNIDAVFLSINRYERKKNLDLCVLSLKQLLEDKNNKKSIHLIIAGGYDPLNTENIEYYQDLVKLTHDLGVKQNITFVRSFTDNEKQLLLHNCTAVIYTPENEHFGIVPVEAMYMRRPVIAVNSGGPRETVIDGQTGYLCDNTPQKFSEAMNKFVDDKDLAREMGIEAFEHVKKKFNFTAFQSRINNVLLDVLNGAK